MAYVLYQEIKLPLTKAQEKAKAEPTRVVTRFGTAATKEQANNWVNFNSQVRSWVEHDN